MLLTCTFELALSDHVRTIPHDVVPVDILSSKTKLKIPFTLPSVLQPPNPPPNATTWEEYTLQLPSWEQELLQHTEILDLPQLLTTLKEDDTIYLASNGGAIHLHGSFGGVIANKTTILAEVGGRAQGANPRSFWAEGYGSLATSTLCRHLCHFHQITRDLDLHISCDNSGLITRLDKAFDKEYNSPRSFLRSKMDVQMQIVSTLQNIPGTRTFQHVRGHQDRDPKKKLSWLAQLNKRSDEIASNHLDNSLTPLN